MLVTYNLRFRPSISVWDKEILALDSVDEIQDNEECRQVDHALNPSGPERERFEAEEGVLGRGVSPGGKI
jgi:hypothetical protein